MAKIEFEDGVVYIDPPKRPKKITGTRFAAVMGANKWQTAFQSWCEITKAWVKPFEDTIYTIAGKAIEAKQLTWFSRLLPIVRPEDVYGKDFFDKTFGDFFHDNKIFGGMWDSLVGTVDDIQGVIECKTTKRAEDWEDDVPEYYALQAALYAYLLHVDDVYMVVTFLEESDYEAPDKFEVSADNTAYVHFKVSERYPNFSEYIDWCEKWWHNHIDTGISPAYDETLDKEYIAGLKTHVIDSDESIDKLLEEAETLYEHIDEVEKSIKADKKRLSEIESMLKTYAIEHETESQTKSIYKSNNMTWTVTKNATKSIDVDRMQHDGIYDDYLVLGISYKITKSINKE